jgi:DNA polymerase III delta subunit
LNNLFLFTGEETYLLTEQIHSWKRAFIQKHGDINLEVLDATRQPLNEVMASVNAMPFLGDKRLIFIHGLPDQPKTRNADKVSKKDEKRDMELKKLAGDLGDIPESSIVVFVQ